jgi:hypothetical protein
VLRSVVSGHKIKRKVRSLRVLCMTWRASLTQARVLVCMCCVPVCVRIPRRVSCVWSRWSRWAGGVRVAPVCVCVPVDCW